MSLLNKKNWWIWMLFSILSLNISVIILGALLDLIDKNAWYANKKYWILGTICFVIPAFIMLFVFVIEMLCKVSAKLKVPGSELYLSPYIWIIFLIVPIIGWVFFLVTILYLTIWYLVALYKGDAEKYIK